MKILPLSLNRLTARFGIAALLIHVLTAHVAANGDGLTDAEVDTANQTASLFKDIVPNVKGEVAAVPADYDRIPVQVIIPELCPGTGTPAAGDPYLKIWDYHAATLDVEEELDPETHQYVGLYELEVDKLYLVLARGLYINFQVDPGYVVLLNGKDANAAAMYASSDGVDCAAEVAQWLRIVPVRDQQLIGEAHPATLTESFNWAMSLGTSYAGLGTEKSSYDFFPPLSPSNDMNPLNPGSGTFTPAFPLGHMSVRFGLKDLSLSNVLAMFKTSDVLDLPAFMVDGLAKAQSGAVTTYFYGASASVGDYEYEIEIENSVDANQNPIGFDVRMLKDGTQYRKYSFLVDDGMGKVVLSVYRASKLLRTETLSYASGAWSLETRDGAAPSIIVRKQTALFPAITQSCDVGSSCWDVELRDYGWDGQALSLSSYKKKHFDRMAYSTRLESNASSYQYSSNRLRLFWRFADGGGATSVGTKYDYYSDNQTPGSLTKLKWIWEYPQESGMIGSGYWERYVYFDQHYNVYLDQHYVETHSAEELDYPDSMTGMGDAVLSGKVGRLFKIYKPFKDAPLSPMSANDAEGSVTRIYYSNYSLEDRTIRDVISGKTERINGKLVSRLLTGISTGDDGLGLLDYNQMFYRQGGDGIAAVLTKWSQVYHTFDQTENGQRASAHSIVSHGNDTIYSYTYLIDNPSELSFFFKSFAFPEVAVPAPTGWTIGSSVDEVPAYAELELTSKPGYSGADYFLSRRFFNRYSELLRTEDYISSGALPTSSNPGPLDVSWTLLNWENRRYVDHRLIEVWDSRSPQAGGRQVKSLYYYGASDRHFGRLQKIVEFNGTETSYEYDCMDRLVRRELSSMSATISSRQLSLPSVMEDYRYDGTGRELEVQTAGKTKVVRRYDLAGRLLVEFNADGDGVLYDHSEARSGTVRKETVWGTGDWQLIWKAGTSLAAVRQFPDPVSYEITDSYRDGRLRLISGSAVTSESHDYAVQDYDEGNDRACIVETIETGPASGAHIVTSIGRDLAGRITYIEQPSFGGGVRRTNHYYQLDSGLPFSLAGIAPGMGMRSKTVVTATGEANPMTTATLYEYDVSGRLVVERMDLESDQSESVDNFTDLVAPREKMYSYGYIIDDQSSWWQESLVEARNDDASQSKIVVQRSRERLNNFTQVDGYVLSAETRTWEMGSSTDPLSATISTVAVNPSLRVERSRVVQPGDRTTESYSAQGIVILDQEPGGGVSSYILDSQRRVSSAIGVRGIEEEREYKSDAGLKISRVLAPVSPFSSNLQMIKSFEYESGGSGGKVIKEVNAKGKNIRYEYDSRGSIVRKWGSATYPISYTYDGFGRKHTMTTYLEDKSGENMIFEAEEWPESPVTGGVTTWEYDQSSGLLHIKKDPNNKLTEYDYDKFNRITGRLLPNKNLKVTIYNRYTGEVWAHKYYENELDFDNPVDDDESTPDVHFVYDRLGNVQMVSDGTGERTFFYSDSKNPLEASTEGRLHGEEFNVGSATYFVNYDYDVARRRLAMLHHGLGAPNVSIEFDYNTSGRKGTLHSVKATKAGGGDQTFIYSYQSQSSWISKIDAGDFTHNRGYESTRNMVLSTSNKWGQTTLDSADYYRDELGRVTDLIRSGSIFNIYNAGGLEQAFGYTSRGELSSSRTSSFYDSPTPLPGRLFELSYDGQGNRDQLKVDGALSHDYTPGAANEYTNVSYFQHVQWVAGMSDFPGRVAVGDDLAVRQSEYFYRGFSAASDSWWSTVNIFASDEPPSHGYISAYSSATKEIYQPPPSVTPTYDEVGNLTYDGWWNYEYDGENRLIRMISVVHLPGETKWRELQFAYDYLGRRIKKTVSDVTSLSPLTRNTLSVTGYAYWDWHLIGEINLSTNTMLRHYAWGLDKEGVRPGAGGVGGLLMISDSSTSKNYYAMNDYIGNVIGLVDSANGSVVAAYEYDPFGRAIRATGTYAEQNPIRFSSQYTDNETGLVYFGFRFYHPQWGRFINRDPIEEAGGENLYRFVSNDPVNRWDLLGLMEYSSRNDDYHSEIDLWERKWKNTVWAVGDRPRRPYWLDDGKPEVSDRDDEDTPEDEPQVGNAQEEAASSDLEELENRRWFIQEQESSCVVASVRNLIWFKTGRDIPEDQLRQDFQEALGDPNHDFNEEGVFNSTAIPVLEKYGLHYETPILGKAGLLREEDYPALVSFRNHTVLVVDFEKAEYAWKFLVIDPNPQYEGKAMWMDYGRFTERHSGGYKDLVPKEK